MKRFQFRLDRVLGLRAAAERQQASVLGRAAGAEAERRERTEASQSRLESVEDQAGARTGEVAAGVLRAYGLALDAARSQVEADLTALHAAAQLREVEAAKFAEARRARRVLERLRQRRAEDWAQDAARQEQGAMDEVALRRTGTTDR